MYQRIATVGLAVLATATLAVSAAACSVVDDGVAVAAVARTSRRDVSADTGAARATSPRASDDPIAATSTATNIALIAPRY